MTQIIPPKTQPTQTPVKAQQGEPSQRITKYDVFALSPEGFEVHFALEGERIFADAIALSKAMSEAGFTPRASKATDTGTPQAPNQAGEPSCPEHGPNRVKASHFGGFYCSGKVNGGFCSWKSTDN